MRIASLSLLVVLSTVSCALFGQAPANEETGLPLSLGDALRQALNRNYLVESSRLDSEVSAQTVRGAAGVYDPTLTARYNYENTNLLGEPRDEELASASTGIEGLLPFGGTYRIGYQVEDRTSLQFDLFSTDPGYRWRDRVTAHLGAEFTQPLLRGFLANDAQTNLLVARRRHEQSLEGFRADVITTVTNTIQAYHDLYFAQRNLTIAERNRANAQQLLEDNRRRVEAGAMAPLDIYQAESEAAVRESAVISARRLRRSAENRLKGLIFNDPSKVLEARFSVPALPAPSPVQVNPVDDREIALNRRPDYLNAVVEEDIRENQLKSDRWAARPQLDLVASAGRYTDSGTLGRSNSELAERGDDQALPVLVADVLLEGLAVENEPAFGIKLIPAQTETILPSINCVVLQMDFGRRGIKMGGSR